MTTATQDTILATIKVDMDTAEKSKQWPFSCYAVTKDMKGCLSGFIDISAEELRLNFLMNKSNLSVHNESLNELQKHIQANRERMKNPREQGNKIYDEYREGGHSNPSGLEDLSFLNTPGAVFKSKLVQQQSSNSTFGSSASSFGSAFGSQQKTNPFSSQTSMFGSSSGNSSNNSLFGQLKQNPFGSSNPSSTSFGSTPFGSAQTNTFGSNPFGSSNNQAAKSNFGSNQGSFASSSTSGTNQVQQSGGFGSNPFGSSNPNTQSSTSSLFGSQATNQPSTFGNKAESGAFSGASVFGSAKPAEKQNPFASTTNQSAFGSQNSNVQRENPISGQEDSIIYSNISDLTQEEIQAFQAAEFTLQNIPINPPYKDACVS